MGFGRWDFSGSSIQFLTAAFQKKNSVSTQREISWRFRGKEKDLFVSWRVKSRMSRWSHSFFDPPIAAKCYWLTFGEALVWSTDKMLAFMHRKLGHKPSKRFVNVIWEIKCDGLKHGPWMKMWRFHPFRNMWQFPLCSSDPVGWSDKICSFDVKIPWKLPRERPVHLGFSHLAKTNTQSQDADMCRPTAEVAINRDTIDSTKPKRYKRILPRLPRKVPSKLVKYYEWYYGFFQPESIAGSLECHRTKPDGFGNV